MVQSRRYRRRFLGQLNLVGGSATNASTPTSVVTLTHARVVIIDWKGEYTHHH
jgi:hypothetical protein